LSLEQTDEFADWLQKLRDTVGRARILKRLRRLGDGQFGDVKAVGNGVQELRMFFGPGYRAYFMQRGEAIILLLIGGDKDSQAGDIARAKELAGRVRDGSEDKPF
jgi:putative addiction module killer protein